MSEQTACSGVEPGRYSVHAQSPDPYDPDSRDAAKGKSRSIFLSSILALALYAPAAQTSPQSFKAEADLVTIDVQITATHGAAIRDFGPADFVVEVGGHKRTGISATQLHFDEASVVRDLARVSDKGPACVFGFHRKKDLRTVHYLIGVERTDADRTQVKRVEVTVVDKAFHVVFLMWRSPVKSPALGPAEGHRHTI